MTLDELILEWSYRTNKGYPCLDNPSDITILRTLLERLNLPAEKIIDELEDEDVDFMHSLDKIKDYSKEKDLDTPGTAGMEDSPLEKDKEVQKQAQNIKVDCVLPNEKETIEAFKKLKPKQSHQTEKEYEEDIMDDVKDFINKKCKKPLNKAIQSKKWAVNQKGEVNHKQLDTYTDEILKLSKNLTSEEKIKWVNYLNSPEKHINFKPTIGTVGNLLDTMKTSGLPSQLLENLMYHTSRDEGNKGIGAGEFGMSLIFKNIEASIGGGDLTLDGEEFEIKGENAVLGKKPDEVNPLELNKLAEFVDELDDELGDDNVDVVQKNIPEKEWIKLRYSKETMPKASGKGTKTQKMITYKGKLENPAQFSRIISDIYNSTPNKEEFKEAFKESLLVIEPAAKQMHAEAIEQFWPEMKFDTSKDVQNSIALLNFYRYILKEGFTKFLAHDMGAGRIGKGQYIYAEGSPMEMTKMLLDAGAKFQPVNPANMKPRIGFGSKSKTGAGFVE